MSVLSRIRGTLCRLAGRFTRREDGAVTVDFVIVVPAFLMILVAGIESGVTLTRQVILDRALDIAVRDLRLGRIEDPSHAKLRTSICENVVIIANCETVLLLELVEVPTRPWDLPAPGTQCIDRDAEIEPEVTFETGGSNDMMLIRACVIIDPLFPTTPFGLGLPLDATGGYQLFAMAAFVNEPRDM